VSESFIMGPKSIDEGALSAQSVFSCVGMGNETLVLYLVMGQVLFGVGCDCVWTWEVRARFAYKSLCCGSAFLIAILRLRKCGVSTWSVSNMSSTDFC